MSDTTNDIDQLLALLSRMAMSTNGPIAKRRHNALTALVAERNALLGRVAEQDADILALRKRVAELEKELKSRNEAYEELRWRIVEKSWSHPSSDRDRELRERLICAAMTGLCADFRFEVADADRAVAIADRTLAAMRKGEA